MADIISPVNPATATPWPIRDDEDSGFESSLNPQQRAVFDALMVKMRASEFWPDLDEMPDNTSHYVLRFCRASMKHKSSSREFVLVAAEQRLIKTLTWRREKNVTGLRKQLDAGVFPDKWDFYNQVRPKLMWIDSLSGRPVLLERIGLFGSNVKISEFTMDEWERFFICENELLLSVTHAVS
jgi:hypothetical protein